MLVLWCVTNAVLFDNYFEVQTIVMNMSFLFGLVPGLHAGIVWAGWTIGVEMIFYLIFPIVVLLAHAVSSAALIWVLSLILSAKISFSSSMPT
jgi:peptidoglycan/LPS O-acetylase OafA/YrhL